MKNEAIVSCVGDIALKFLEITLFQNIQFFDNYIVITDSKSKNIQDFCKKWPVSLLITDEFYRNGAKFNRGRTYNQAFGILSYKDEIALLDVDTFIPDKTGEIIKNIAFDKNIMYGCRRVIVPKYNDFIKLLNGDNDLEKSLWNCDGIAFGFHQTFNYNADSFNGNQPVYFQSHDTSEEDWRFRNKYFGDLSADAKQYFGNLKEIDSRLWHLGEPNISGGKNFFT